MNRVLSSKAQLFTWGALYLFWVFFSIPFHPSLIVDIVVTLELLVAYAGAIYFNVLFLAPSMLHGRSTLSNGFMLVLSLMLGTFLAFSAVRGSYSIFGFGDALGDYWQNYFIDLFGMIIHLAAASILLRIISRKQTVSL